MDLEIPSKGSGTSLPQAGAQGPELLVWTKIKFLLGLKLWGFLAMLESRPKIPVPASLCTLPMPSDSQDSLASLPLAHRYLPAGIRVFSSQNLPPLPCPSQCPQPCPLRALWDSAAVVPLSLHLFLMCQQWQQTGTETSLCLWNILRKKEEICPKPGAGKSKSFC